MRIFLLSILLSLACGQIVSAETSAPDLSIQTVTPTTPKSTETYSVNFGSVMVNMRSVQGVRITNTGNMPIVLNEARISGMGYSADYDCGTLAPNESCHVDISFWPTMKGFQTGRLYMMFDTDEMIFDLSGWGQ